MLSTGRAACGEAGERAPGARGGRTHIDQPESTDRVPVYTRPLPGHIRGKPTSPKHGKAAEGGTTHKKIVIIKAESGKCISLPL